MDGIATFAVDICSLLFVFSPTSVQLESPSLNLILGTGGAKFLRAKTGTIDLASFAMVVPGKNFIHHPKTFHDIP